MMKTKKQSRQPHSSLQKMLRAERAALAQRLKTLEKEDPFSQELEIRGDNDEVATRTAAHDRVNALRFTLRERYDEIEATLQKIAHGTYGTCESCQKPIQKARLVAFPTARFCVLCQGKR